MQSMFNLRGTYGLPLCVSGFTHQLTFSKEMIDHDRRREAMKKQRSRAREGVHANQELGFQRVCEIFLEETKRGQVDDDEVLLGDLSYTAYSCISKAA